MISVISKYLAFYQLFFFGFTKIKEKEKKNQKSLFKNCFFKECKGYDAFKNFFKKKLFLTNSIPCCWNKKSRIRVACFVPTKGYPFFCFLLYVVSLFFVRFFSGDLLFLKCRINNKKKKDTYP